MKWFVNNKEQIRCILNNLNPMLWMLLKLPHQGNSNEDSYLWVMNLCCTDKNHFMKVTNKALATKVFME